MPDESGRDDVFLLSKGRAEGAIATNIGRSLESLLPEEIRQDRTVAWFRRIQERASIRGRGDDHGSFAGRYRDSVIPAMVPSVLQPVIQARLDFLAQSLYTISRVVGVSVRAIGVIQASNTPRGIEAALGRLDDVQGADADELRDAVRGSLPSLLAALDETHGSRYRLAMHAFGEWVAEAEDFRSAFEPADEMLGVIADDRRGRDRDRVVSDLGTALAPLVLYLSKYPRLDTHVGPSGTVAGDRDSLILSPGEVIGVLALLTNRYDRYGDWHLVDEFTATIRELSLESLTVAELARLGQRVANSNPFEGKLVGPPPESLQAAMRDHVLSNGRRSPWLREFLNRLGRPLELWNNTLAIGTPDDTEYIKDLTRSAGSTIVHKLLSTDRHLGESWNYFLDRLFREEWLESFRRLATRQPNRERWTRDNFVAVGVAVCVQLRQEGYHISANEQTLASLWDSA